jgi:hypothetical protein
MSLVVDFDALIDVFNSSARVIREHLASQNTNDKITPSAGNETPSFPLASAPENVRDAQKALAGAMGGIQKIFLDPVEMINQTTINVSGNKTVIGIFKCLQTVLRHN